MGVLFFGVCGCRGTFKPVESEKDIFATDASHREDLPALLDAARKAVAHGNKVYILPNPKGIRTADFIFENKGIYKMYDFQAKVRAIKKPLVSGSFKIGAGSIRAYPHAENTGLVFSDTAKIQLFSLPASVLLFFSNLVGALLSCPPRPQRRRTCTTSLITYFKRRPWGLLLLFLDSVRLPRYFGRLSNHVGAIQASHKNITKYTGM